MMEFGIGLNNYKGCWDDAAFAEQHGFSSVGFIDSPLISGDPFTAMALTAQATSTMRLGTYLNIPTLRSTTVTAAAMSSLNELAPGRVFFGTGTGYTGRQTFGLNAIPLSRVVNDMNEVRSLLAGEEIEYRSGKATSQVRMINKAQLENNQEHPVPLYLAADGPRGLEAAGSQADGWLTTLHFSQSMRGTMMNAPEVFEELFGSVKTAASDAGKDTSDLFTCWSTAISILRDGEPVLNPRTLDQAGPMGMFAFHSYGCNPEIGEHLPPFLKDRLDIYEKKVLSKFTSPRERHYQEVHEGHLTHLIHGEADVLTEDILRFMTLTGSAEEIAEQLKKLHDKGLKNVTLMIPPQHLREVVVEIEERIMPLVNG